MAILCWTLCCCLSCFRNNFTFHEICFVPYKTAVVFESFKRLKAILINTVNYDFALPSVPSNYSYLSEGSILRLQFDFLDKAGKTGLLTKGSYVLVFVSCCEIVFFSGIVNARNSPLFVCMTNVSKGIHLPACEHASGKKPFALLMPSRVC